MTLFALSKRLPKEICLIAAELRLLGLSFDDLEPGLLLGLRITEADRLYGQYAYLHHLLAYRKNNPRTIIFKWIYLS